MDGEFIREIASLCHAHRVYLAHEIRNGDVGRRQFLTIAPVARQPCNLDAIAELFYLVAAGLAYGFKGVVIYFAPIDYGDHIIQEIDQVTRHTGLCLATFAKKDDVLPGENGVFDLWDNGLLIAYNPRKDVFPSTDLLY